jgi:hypothetical protein
MLSMFDIGIWLAGGGLCAIQPQAEEAMHILGASSDILIGMCWVPKEIRLHLCTSILIAHACYF